MPRGGYRPGAGRPKGKDPAWMPKNKRKESPPQTKEEVEVAAENADMTPVEYMLKVMRDPSEPKDRRDKMAIAAAPYVHAKAEGKSGKKHERQEAAKDAAMGKYAPMSGPKLVNFNK